MQDSIKDYLKFAGTGWLACAAYTAYNASEGIQKHDVSLASATGMAAILPCPHRHSAAPVPSAAVKLASRKTD